MSEPSLCLPASAPRSPWDCDYYLLPPEGLGFHMQVGPLASQVTKCGKFDTQTTPSPNRLPTCPTFTHLTEPLILPLGIQKFVILETTRL